MARRKQDHPHPPGTEIPLHTVEALTRVIDFINANADQFEAQVKDAPAVYAILEMVRAGRASFSNKEPRQ